MHRRAERRDARRAMTSFAFMFVLVPLPVWNTSSGNCSACLPRGHFGAASAMAAPTSAGSRPSSALARAAAALISASAAMKCARQRECR